MTIHMPKINTSNNEGGGGGKVKEVALLSITIAPTGEFAKGSKYYNLTDKKIYTAVVADSWDGATVDDPQFGTYYLYNNTTYVWDGNSLEESDLENFVKKTDIVNNLETADATKVLSAEQGQILDEKKQDKTDNNLETENKTIVGAINEINQSMIGLPDLVISQDTVLSNPLFYNGRVIINSGVTITVDEPRKSLIIKCKELVNNGTIDVSGKGFQGKKVIYGEGVGYCDGDNVDATAGSRAGGGAPSSNKPSAYRTMLGLASAVGGSYQDPYGPGYDGTNGGGGGGGSDGGPLSGGGSGAGGGGGGAGHGSYLMPKGGNGSQADIDVNLQLFKNNQLEEIPLFGASGASGWQDDYPTSMDTSNGGGNIQIYSDKITNNGVIKANGETIYLTTPNENGGCGGAGGGCIMIRCTHYTDTGIIEARGSKGHVYETATTVKNPVFYYGGDGGDGLVLVDIVDNNYNDLINKPQLCEVELVGNKVLTDIINSPDNTIIIGDNSIQVSGNLFYTKTQVDTLVAGISSTYIVSQIPVNPDNNTYYLVGNDNDGYVLYYYDTQGTQAIVGQYTLDLQEYINHTTNLDSETLSWDNVGKKLSSKAIIPVNALPTTNIKQSLYLMDNNLYYYDEGWKLIKTPLYTDSITITAGTTEYTIENKAKTTNLANVRVCYGSGAECIVPYTVSNIYDTITFSVSQEASNDLNGMTFYIYYQ